MGRDHYNLCHPCSPIQGSFFNQYSTSRHKQCGFWGNCSFLFFLIGKPWTLQYLSQQFLSKSLIWPTIFNECRCNRETLSWIEEAGFKMVEAEKIWLDWSPEMFVGSATSTFISRVCLCFINSILLGFAGKGEDTEKKKELWLLTSMSFCKDARFFRHQISVSF